MTTTTWTNMPNLRTFSLTEGLRLVLIVGSLVTIALAGQLAQSRANNEAIEQQAAITAAPAAPAHHMTKTERYARTQIQTFSDLLDGLTERAEILIASKTVNEADAAELKTSLRQLDEDLMVARESFKNFAKKSDRFNKEDLRESLMAVQDSATLAQSQVITLDTAANH